MKELFLMCGFIRSTLLVLVATAILYPHTASSFDVKKEVLPIIQKLQEGKAKLSFDKKSIVDEEGHIIAKESANLDMNKYKTQPAKNPFEAAKDDSPPQPQLFTCNRKCGIVTKHCYVDENENAVCINVCDKESLICE
jgi:hypothetical protein